MSTKNLARTVIEGGRRYYNCWERRHSHAEARAAERAVAATVRTHDADDLVWPEPKHVGRSFHDKLSPAERWLRSNVGRPWDLVRSEIFARFDTRTLAGQHIVFDHLLRRRWDRDETWSVSRDARFRVDRRGILRAEMPRRVRWHSQAPYVPDLAEATRLANGRKVVRRGTRLYWGLRVVPFELDAAPRYRQDRALSESELRAFDALSEAARASIELHLS